jgi:hypothetical protein
MGNNRRAVTAATAQLKQSNGGKTPMGLCAWGVQGHRPATAQPHAIVVKISLTKKAATKTAGGNRSNSTAEEHSSNNNKMTQQRQPKQQCDFALACVGGEEGHRPATAQTRIRRGKKQATKAAQGNSSNSTEATTTQQQHTAQQQQQQSSNNNTGTTTAKTTMWFCVGV